MALVRESRRIQQMKFLRFAEFCRFIAVAHGRVTIQKHRRSLSNDSLALPITHENKHAEIRETDEQNCQRSYGRTWVRS